MIDDRPLEKGESRVVRAANFSRLPNDGCCCGAKVRTKSVMKQFQSRSMVDCNKIRDDGRFFIGLI